MLEKHHVSCSPQSWRTAFLIITHYRFYSNSSQGRTGRELHMNRLLWWSFPWGETCLCNTYGRRLQCQRFMLYLKLHIRVFYLNTIRFVSWMRFNIKCNYNQIKSMTFLTSNNYNHWQIPVIYCKKIKTLVETEPRRRINPELQLGVVWLD